MNQICNKCSEYASICVHMADEREAEYRVKKASKEFIESLQKISSIMDSYLTIVIMKEVEIINKKVRAALLKKYCQNHNFYNAWDL